MAADGVRLDRPLTLLLQACLCSEDKAAAAWRAWQALRPFEDVSGAEVRLLAPLATRLRMLDPGSPLLPRIAGIARARWTMAQFVLRAAGEAAALLADASTPCLVFGPAATHLDDLGADARREVGAVDMLLPAEAFADAARRLSADGWHSVDGASTTFVERAAAVRNRMRFVRGSHGDVALWKVPFARCHADLAALALLWARAVPAGLGDRAIRVPDSTDAVLVALAHGGADGGWVLETVQRARRQSVDWEGLAEAAARWRLSADIGGRLELLIREFDLQAHVPARLAADRRTFAEQVSTTVTRGLVGRWARRTLVGRGYVLPPDDAPGVPALRARRSAEVGRAGEYEIRRSVAAGSGRLLLGFPPEAMGRPFRIEASAGGMPLAVVRGRVRAPVHAVAWPFGPGPLDLAARPLAIEREGFGRVPTLSGEPVPFRARRG